MYDKSKVLAVIPARGGSKGLPRKNIRTLAGKPMLAWTIDAAKGSRHIDRVILSSDDEEICSCAREYGCEVPFVRPASLAQDNSDSMSVLFHALEQLPGYDMVVLLQPTSPLRTSADIDGAIDKLAERNAQLCVSVTTAKSPAWMYSLDNDDMIHPLLELQQQALRRQDLPPAYILNGAVYVGMSEYVRTTRTFLTSETVGYVMPKERSVDVDDEIDFAVAETLLRLRS